MATRLRLSVAFAVGCFAAGLSACTTQPDIGPAPTDAVVYDATAETRNATGIEKWGYGTDAAGTTTFHGYGARNEPIVALSHVFQITSQFTRRFMMKMSGPEVSASVYIEYESLWDEATQSVQVVAHVIENTVPPGGLAMRILERVAPDATTVPDRAAAGTFKNDLAQTNVKPLDGALVTDTGELVTCCCQLQNDGASLAGATLSECGQTGMAASAGVQTAALVPLDLPRPPPQDLIVGANGTPQVDSPWVPPYRYPDNMCHQAAIANLSSDDSWVACRDTSDTTDWGGHTVNWTWDPTKPGNKRAYCIYEPQANGKTLVDGAACCWEGDALADGKTPKLDSPAAAACAKKMCGNQYNPPSAGEGATEAKPLGTAPLVAPDCPTTTNNNITCNTCCQEIAKKNLAQFGRNGTFAGEFDPDKFDAWTQDYMQRCTQGCFEHRLVNPGSSTSIAPKTFTTSLRPLDVSTPADVRATRCLASGLAANDALALAKASCEQTGKLPGQ